MAKSMEERLATMADGWSAARAQYDQRFGGVKIDAGEYIAKLQRCELGVRKSDDVVVINVEYLILDGKFKGYVAFDQMNLNNEWGRIFAIRFVNIAGYEFPESADVQKLLPKTCATIAKDASTFKIDAIHNGDFVNFQAKSIVSDDGSVPAPETPAPKTTDARKKATAPATAPATADPFAAMERKALKEYIREKELDIHVTAKMSDDEIRTAIRSQVEPPAAEVDGKPTDEELVGKLLILCKSHGIKEVKKDMALDDMVDIVEEYEFSKSEIDDDEAELLETLNLAKCIKD